MCCHVTPETAPLPVPKQKNPHIDEGLFFRLKIFRQIAYEEESRLLPRPPLARTGGYTIFSSHIDPACSQGISAFISPQRSQDMIGISAEM